MDGQDIQDRQIGNAPSRWKQPETTLRTSILREINAKSKDAGFKKVDGRMFALAAMKYS